MTDTDDDLIRKRAYEIWEAEGFPEGREYAHWEQAVRELGEQQGSGDAVTRMPTRPLSIVQSDVPAEPVEVAPKKRGKAAS